MSDSQKKPTRKIVVRILILIVPLYIVWYFYITKFPLLFDESNQVHWYSIKKTLNERTRETSIKRIFTGDSRVNAGFEFSELPHSYSFATGGAGPIEIFYILKKYIKTHPKPDTVFVSISPRFFTETMAFYPYALRNDFFSYADFSEMMRVKNYFVNDTILGHFPWFKYALYRIKYPGYYQQDVFRSYGFTAYSDNKSLLDEISRQHGARPHPGLQDMSSALNFETGMESFIPSSILNFYFNLIFQLCRTENIHLIFFTMPMNKSSVEKLHPKFKDDFVKFLSEYSRLYPEFQISDTIFSYSDSCFGDASHLNKKGKKIFTQYFKTDFLTNSQDSALLN